MNKLAALLLAGSLLGGATAADKAAVLVVGAGAQPCAAWTSGRTAGPTDPQRVYEALILSWVQGYMSGVNMALPERLPLPGNDFLNAALDDYCAHHSQDTVWKATMAVYALWAARNLGFGDGD